jgi:hypothetical protein
LEYWVTAKASPATFNDAEFVREKYTVQFTFVKEHPFLEEKPWL